MTSLTAVGASPPTSLLVLPRTAAADPPTATASTVLNLGSAAQTAVVYARPVAMPEPAPAMVRSWAASPQDAISTLMARNAGGLGGGSLSAQWRGLGSALLDRLAQQPGDYRQTLVQHASGVAATDALASARDNAVTVQLRIQTRSGTTVELSIAVNRGANQAQSGLQVEISSAGPLTDAERQALAALGEGLDKALAGLGRADTPQLDLAGLLAYDKRLLSSLDLTVRSPTPTDPLRTFSLQVNAREQRLEMQGKAGELALRLDAAAPLASAREDQRQAAIAQYLAQFDAAGERGHVGAELVTQLRQAFVQLHGAPGATPTAAAGTPQAVQNQVAPLLSGLADFELRLSGEFQKTNENGYLAEMTQARYEVTQRTQVQRTSASGDIEATQTRSAVLQASTMRALGQAELDLTGGNYHLTTIDDDSRSTTTVATDHGKLVRAEAEQVDQQLLTYAKLLNHHVVDTHTTPRKRHTTEDLLRGGTGQASLPRS